MLTKNVAAVLALALCSAGADAQTMDPPLRNWPAPMLWQPPSAQSASEQEKGAATREAAITGQLVFVGVQPCRLVDTRDGTQTVPFGTPILGGGQTRTYTVPNNPRCAIPNTAKAYSVNFTVVPSGPLGYLTAWPTPNRPVPEVSILNSFDGGVVANAAVVPAGTNGAIDVFVTNTTEVIIDINGYYVDRPAAQYKFSDFSGGPGTFMNSVETCPAGTKVTGCACGGIPGSNELNVTIRSLIKDPNGAEGCHCVAQNTGVSGDVTIRRAVFCQ
ncbi:MAG: hypothetical protein SFV51_20675 [Bryobacteraceae bacterium]|nr:hypothetical protein [Bryobacteraceae bacterium]